MAETSKIEGAGQPMKTVTTEPRHEAFFQDVVAVLNKHYGALDSVEMLAISARLVGMLIALQDQRRMTSTRVMDLVAENIKAGNAHAIAGVFSGIDMEKRQ